MKRSFLKKSVQSIRRSKTPESARSLDEPRARGASTQRNDTAEITLAGKKGERASEARTTSANLSSNKGGSDSEPEDATDTSVLSVCEIARNQLFKASQDLQRTLRLYFSSDDSSTSHGKQYANIKVPLSAGKDGCDADKLADLLSAVTSQHCGQTLPSLSAKVSSAFGKIYPLTNVVLKLGVAAGDAFSPIKATMGSLAVLLSIAETERLRSADFLLELQKITYQSSRIAELQKNMTESEMGDSLIERSTRLLTAITVYFRDSIIYLGHSYFRNVGKTLVQGEQVYDDAKQRLQVAIQEYDQALLLQIAISTLSAKPRHMSIGEEESKAQGDLVRWLDASFWETEAQYSSHKERQEERTLLWLLDLDSFKRWQADEAPLLWLTGPPGAGKSILAAYLVQLLASEEPQAAVLYFFCRAGNTRLNTRVRLIRTLAAQIIMSIPKSVTHFRQLRDEGFGSEDESLLLKKLVEEPLSHCHETKYIIIDGLDESLTTQDDTVNGDRREAFLRGLQKLDAKIVLTSRPMPNTLEHLGKCLHHRITFENAGDIEAYVFRRVSQSSVLQKGFDKLEKNEPAKFVSDKSQGNFLWVAITLGLLEKKSVSAKSFQAGIDNIPESLGQVYDELLRRLDAAGTLGLVRVILGCVLFSMSPLTIETLHAATAILYEDVFNFEEFIRVECGSFLAIVPSAKGPSTVQVLHETFKSYITTEEGQAGSGLNKRICHLQMAVACLKCLTCEAQDLEPLRDYASQYWLTHFVAFRRVTSNHAPGPQQLNQLLIGLFGLLADKVAFSTWIKRWIFIIQEKTRIGYFCFEMRDMFNEVLAWLKLSEVEQICSNVPVNAKEDPRLGEAVAWREKTAASEGGDWATWICQNLSRTWLWTNWADYSLSQSVFIHSMKTAKILKVIASPGESFDPKTRVMSMADYKSISTAQLNELVKLGDFKPSVGVQAGNFAFGGFFAHHPATARYYLSAIDEHPDWWHLHEGLGTWYYRINRKKDAAESLKEAMSHSPNALYLYWVTKSEIAMEQDDIPDAIETLQKAESLSNDKEAYKYIDRMATIYRDRREWEKMKDLYSQALRTRSTPRGEYWLALVEAYNKCYDWRGQLKTLVLAIEDDPAGSVWYCRKIGRLADDMKDQMLFSQAVEILETAKQMANVPPGMHGQFQVRLARSHLAAREWDKAIKLCTVSDDGHDSEVQCSLSNILGHAHLAQGEVEQAIAEFEKHSIHLPEVAGLAYMMAGQFRQAIQLLKSGVTAFHAKNPQGPDNTVVAGTIMEMHRDLGECYETAGRHEDSLSTFQEGLAIFERFVDEHKSIPSSGDSTTVIFRCHARPFMVYGDLLTALSRVDNAREYFQAAERIMSRARFVGDDDILEWEYEECTRRIVNPSMIKDLTPLERRDVWAKRLELEICSSYRVNWYSFMSSEMPRYRGGEEGWAARILGGDAREE